MIELNVDCYLFDTFVILQGDNGRVWYELTDYTNATSDDGSSLFSIGQTNGIVRTVQVYILLLLLLLLIFPQAHEDDPQKR